MLVEDQSNGSICSEEQYHVRPWHRNMADLPISCAKIFQSIVLCVHQTKFPDWIKSSILTSAHKSALGHQLLPLNGFSLVGSLIVCVIFYVK